MNQFETRAKEILEVLLKNEKYVTLELLAQEVNISKRSIQNYLNKITCSLNEMGINEVKLLKKQGYGIKLLIEEKDKEKLDGYIHGGNFSLYDDGVLRRIEMLKALIFSNNELTIQFFADQFYVSRTVILKDLEWVSQWLAKLSIQLYKTQRRGIGVVCNEISRRTAIAEFFDIYKTSEKFLIKDFNASGRLSNEKYLKLKSIYPKIDISSICSIVEDAEKKFDFFLTDEYFITLVTHLVISIARLCSGKKLDESFMPPEAEYGALEKKTADYIATRIGNEFNMALPECECIYICIHLMSYNTFHVLGKSKSEDTLKNIPKKVELLAISLIDYVDALLGTTFTSDKLLFFGIICHLNNSILRLKEKIPVKTISKAELSNANKEILNVLSKVANNLFKGICEVEPTEEELISLAMHFALSQKRNIKKKKAVLVYDKGILEGMKLCKKISEISSDFIVVDVCSSLQLTYKEENEYDFIISTIPLEATQNPVLDLSGIGVNDYLKAFEEFIFSIT